MNATSSVETLSSLVCGLTLTKRDFNLGASGLSASGYFSPGNAAGHANLFRADDSAIVVTGGKTVHGLVFDGVPEAWFGSAPAVEVIYQDVTCGWGQVPSLIFAQLLAKRPTCQFKDLLLHATAEYQSVLRQNGFIWSQPLTRHNYGGACLASVRIGDAKVNVSAVGDCMWVVRLHNGDIINSVDRVQVAQALADFLLANLPGDKIQKRLLFNRFFKPWQRGCLANHLNGDPQGWKQFSAELKTFFSQQDFLLKRLEELLEMLRCDIQEGSYTFFDGQQISEERLQSRQFDSSAVRDVLLLTDGCFDRTWENAGKELFSLFDKGGFDAIRRATETRAGVSPDHTGVKGPENTALHFSVSWPEKVPH